MQPLILKLEIAAQSLFSCLAAFEGGADRIELCTALPTGGLTPGLGLLESARALVDIPINVLIRPRLGNFVYADHEIQLMVQSIRRVRELGGEGVVIGCLTSEGHINLEQLRQLRDAAYELDVTFHRAFDLVRDPMNALIQLKELEFNRILTSGQAPTAVEGRQLIRDLAITAGDDLTVMAGAGVNSLNIGELAEFTGCKEIHASAKKEIQQHSPFDHLGITTSDPRLSTLWESDIEEVRAMKNVLENL